MYVRDELVTAMEPVDVSWMATRASEDFTRLVAYDPTLLEDARRFEMITLPFQDFAGMCASLDLLLELGPRAVERHITKLADQVVRWADAHPSVRLVTSPDPARRAGIIALAPPDPVSVSARLQAAGVVHSLRENTIRLAPHCYNTPDEISRTLEVLERGG